MDGEDGMYAQTANAHRDMLTSRFLASVCFTGHNLVTPCQLHARKNRSSTELV